MKQRWAKTGRHLPDKRRNHEIPIFRKGLRGGTIMTNAAAIGYMIRAAKKTKLDSKTIKILEAIMLEEMDFHTEEEAERTYQNY